MLAPECCKMIGHVQGTCIHKIHHIIPFEYSPTILKLNLHQILDLSSPIVILKNPTYRKSANLSSFRDFLQGYTT